MDLLAFIGLISIFIVLLHLIYPWFSDCNMQLAFLEKFGKPISSLKGKVVWITGASSGIGEHLAYVLAKAGCKLILSARRELLLQNVKKACLEGNAHLKDDDVLVLPLDISNINLHQEAFDTVINKFGKLDILVNNAGRSQRAKWENINIDVDREVFELNVFSHLSLSRIAIKYFLQNNLGQIAVVSSICGLFPAPYSSSYTGSKHALHGYFNSFRVEQIGQNFPSITMICPGPVQTNFLQEAFTEKPRQKFGIETDKADNKISASRCATLSAIAIANEVSEAWISHSSVLFLTYLLKYYPNITSWIVFKFVGKRFLMKLRDAKNSNKIE
ncbi:PREDICTED: dehydrogenase/reductase SDR family member 7 [Polistes dominula]|uniref:Dehydrogenase/reductase SDR family member 7 n=1 Tax=Polistes dominula TaxID=743375 RepID=A0ABM1J9K6_POLDO|nr:PREDICTED: dehydrogenase/reductase SDR family member 7 [Polistes dominula]XP_015189143.1 PREDICTED: dehydrogenase/reductase SDR family member 7 [Polistes dominula]XP_015189144.1 PREDICTED: dehydrogenase/reductase SDR family member 7 [Polistes dominula]XP_015189145.1 PREDICTED: dehydrogenase/reductase SDR family member 7 [Polistes dominula]